MFLYKDIIDMHCHILPGVDDGPESMEESIQTIEEAIMQGVTGIVATPHFHPGRYVVNAEITRKVLKELKDECEKRHIPMKLYEGHECYFHSGLIEELKSGNALTLNHTRMVLLEFDPDVSFTMLKNGVLSLRQHGYQVILAHFERYACLRNPDRLNDIIDTGISLQMNYDTLLRKDTIFHRNIFKKYLKNGIVDYLGSDCHGMDFRPYRIQKACEWMKQQVDSDIAVSIYENNMKIITEKEMCNG